MKAGWYVFAPYSEQHYVSTEGGSLCGIQARDSEAEYRKSTKANKCSFCQYRTGSLKPKKQGENSRAT